MDDIRGGRSNALGGNFLADNYSSNPADPSFFDPLECTTLIDELHKLFQFIDQDAKGYLTVEELLDFQLGIAKKEDVKITKQDENQLISTFFMQVDSKRGHQQNQGGLGIQHQHALLIDWIAFRNTLIEWLTSMSHIGFTIVDQNGNLTSKDKQSLHQILVAFFLHTHKDKRIEVLQRAHLSIENLERDLECLNIYGNSAFSSSTIQQQGEILQASKFIANTFSTILSDIATQQTTQVEGAIQRLRGMLDVLSYFTQRFELLEISDHIRRIFDLVLSSTLLETCAQILDHPDDMKVSPIKLEVLRCIDLLSIGGKLFSQSEIQLLNEDQDGDMQFLQKLQSQLLNYDLIIKVVNQINSNCIEVRDQSLLVIGHLIRNGLDLSQLIFDNDFLGYILQQIYPAQQQTSLRYISWCLYIIAKKYYDPQVMLNPKQISYIQPLFSKLYEILVRDDSPSEELLICTILSMGRVIHLHPQSEVVSQTFDILILILNSVNVQQNILLCQSALRCIYNTVKFTRLHTNTLSQIKLAGYLQMLIDKNFDEKVNLTCLQIIKEMVQSGQHLYIMDNILLGCFQRIVQTTDSSLYSIALDIIKSLCEVTTQNTLHLINFGFLRVICNNLQEFKLYKDIPIQQSYEFHVQETGGFAFGLPRQNSPYRGQSNLKIYSYGFLFKNIHILELFLNFLPKRQQIIASFTQENLDKFKPLVDNLHSQLSALRVIDPVKLTTTEYILKFFHNFRNRTLQIGLDIDSDSQIKYAEFIIQFLQQTLIPFEEQNFNSNGMLNINGSGQRLLNQGNQFRILVKCFDVEAYNNQDNKMFEIPSNVKYKDLQELVNKKYGNLPIQMQYIDEYEEQITVDSDLVLQKAIQYATKTAYHQDEKEITLRLLVHKLSSMYFQCFECGGQYARDPRLEMNAASGGSNICTNCWPKFQSM